MSQFFYSVLLSDVFLFVVLMISFLFYTRWAIGKRSYYQSYGLGWLIGILLMLATGAVLGTSPGEVNPQADVPPAASLNIGQVLVSIFLGFVISGVGMVTSLIWRDNDLRRALQVAVGTGIFVYVLFLMLIAGQGVRYSAGIFTLTVLIVFLFGKIVQDRTPAPAATPDYPAEHEVAPGHDPATGSQASPQRPYRNRIEQIRRDTRREK